MQSKPRSIYLNSFCIGLFFLSFKLYADGITIDKVYDPYVELSEIELEVRSSFFNFSDDRTNTSLHRFGLGYGFTSRFFAEAYMIEEKDETGDYNLEAYEFEAKWQLTEQGEYAFDWGALLEFEHEHDRDAYELSSGILATRELQKWLVHSNLKFSFEWGDDINNELDTSFSTQVRYRYRESLEPAFEVYLGQDTIGAGPIIMGTLRTNTAKKILWEFGSIFGLDDETPNVTIRALLEFEF